MDAGQRAFVHHGQGARRCRGLLGPRIAEGEATAHHLGQGLHDLAHGRAATAQRPELGLFPELDLDPAAEAATLRGTSQFLMDTVKDPRFLEQLMDLCLEVGIEFARAQVRAGADTIGIGDAICSQISPGLYEEMVLPRQKKLW